MTHDKYRDIGVCHISMLLFSGRYTILLPVQKLDKRTSGGEDRDQTYSLN